MSKIKTSYIKLPDGTKLRTFLKLATLLNTLEVEAGTTGYCGGDSGHGCRTYIRIEDLAGTDIKVRKIESGREGNGGVEIVLGGDSELDTIILALKFILRVLKKARGAVGAVDVREVRYE